jgi:hypothetical protein
MIAKWLITSLQIILTLCWAHGVLFGFEQRHEVMVQVMICIGVLYIASRIPTE